MFSQNQARIRNAYRLRRHDLVGEWVLQDAVLMDARFVRERVAPDDRLVGLYRGGRDLAQHLAYRVKLFTRHAGVVRISVRAYAHRHHDLFQGSIAGALADPVNGALNLARTRGDGRHGVGHRQTQVIVAVRRNHDIFNSLDSLPQHLDDLAELRRHRVTDSIGNVHGGRARVNHRLYYLHQKVAIGSGGVFR